MVLTNLFIRATREGKSTLGQALGPGGVKIHNEVYIPNKEKIKQMSDLQAAEFIRDKLVGMGEDAQIVYGVALGLNEEDQK